MNEKKVKIKLPKVGYLVLLILFLIGNGFLLVVWIIYHTIEVSHFGRMYSIFLYSLVIFIGWIFPIILYSLYPKSVVLSESKLVVVYKIGRKRTILKKNIKRIKLVKDIGKRKLWYMTYRKKNKIHVFGFEVDVGKEVYCWYNNKGEWKTEEVEIQR